MQPPIFYNQMIAHLGVTVQELHGIKFPDSGWGCQILLYGLFPTCRGFRGVANNRTAHGKSKHGNYPCERNFQHNFWKISESPSSKPITQIWLRAWLFILSMRELTAILEPPQVLCELFRDPCVLIAYKKPWAYTWVRITERSRAYVA